MQMLALILGVMDLYTELGVSVAECSSLFLPWRPAPRR